MPLILNIETATKNCSVSLAENGKLLTLKEVNDGNYSHGEQLHVLIQEALRISKKTVSDIDGVAVSKGPGSYTGLRIGVSTAKGLCFSLDKPLISISTLTSLAHVIAVEENDIIVPMLDARRMEVYSAVFDNNYNQIRETKAEVINENSFLEYLNKSKVYFLGDGAEKCKTIINNDNAVFLNGYFPSAEQMAMMSNEKYIRDDTEDVAYFEPFYLKDFMITTSKK